MTQEISRHNPQTTELVFILDRSGSMSGLESDTIGGYNAMLSQWQEKDLPIRLSTVLFDHEQVVIHNRERIADVRPLTEREYRVRGTTALLDAVGRAISHIRHVHALMGVEKPEHTVFVITTDGYENASREYTLPAVRKLIRSQKELGWEFIFLGADIDAVGAAEDLGIGASRAVNIVHDGAGVGASFRAAAMFGEALACFSCVPEDWRQEADEDFRKRGGGSR